MRVATRETKYGGLLTVLGLATYFGWDMLKAPLEWATLVFAVLTAVYTAFLFAQAKGRDFWQSPALAVHMLAHSFMAGAAAFSIIALFTPAATDWLDYLKYILITGIIINLLTVLVELTMTHPTKEAKIVVEMITKGRYRGAFWGGAIFFGNLVPLAILFIPGLATPVLALAGLIVLIGIYLTEKIWVEAPQRVQLV